MNNMQRDFERSRNKQAVFEAVYTLRNPTAKEILKFINSDRKKRYKTDNDLTHLEIKRIKIQPIDIRTVQRYLRELINESRIEKKETRYQITENARYEIRYRSPEYFGDGVLQAVFKGLNRWNHDIKRSKVTEVTKRRIMDEYITRFGALIIFSFLEAARPFDDYSMSISERSQLVNDWIKNSIPLQEMFGWFKAEFSPYKRGSTNTTNPKPYNEIDNHDLMVISEIFKSAYPKIYKNLIEARKRLLVHTKLENGKVSYIHGKTYHSDYGKYLSYLKDVNPLAYDNEVKRNLSVSPKKDLAQENSK